MTFEQAVQVGDSSIQTDTSNQANFFKEVYQAFLEVEQVVGSTDRFYTIGEFTIRLRFAGSALTSRIAPALEHLATEPTSSPALTVCLWDSASTGKPLPQSSWSKNPNIVHGEVRGYVDDHLHISHQLGTNILNMLDSELNLAIFWIGDAHQLPYWESGSPVRSILHWWLSHQGLQLVHGAAVGTPEGGVLLVGKGGSGKSTTALTCLQSELVYVSDDYCLAATEPHPYVYSLYNSAKVNADNIQRIPHLKSTVSNTDRLDQEKALMFLHQYCPEKIVKGFPIRAVLLPHVTGQVETTLAPASAAAGLRALAPTTLFQLPGVSRKAFQTMATLVKKIPCYHLELGTDTSKISGVILHFLHNRETL